MSYLIKPIILNMLLPILFSLRWKSVFNFKLIAILLFSLVSFHSNAQEWGEETSSDGSTPIKRHECAYIEVNGKFYLIGGRKAGIEKYVNIYDPVTKKWTQGATTDVPIHHFQPVVYNNKIYVIGAFTGNFPSETPVPNIYIYDPAADTWTKGIDIPEARRRGSAGVVVYNNKIYIVGGITNGHSSGFVKWLDEYDPITNTWTNLTDAPRERDHFQAAIIDNKLILAGGRQTSTANGSNKVIKEVDIYDFTSQTWSTKNNIPTARAGTAAVVAGNELFIIGGEGPNAPAGKAHKETEAYNLASDSWRSVALLITGRHATGAIYHEGKIYIAAGSNAPGGNASTELSSQEVLILSDNSNTGKLVFDAAVNFGQVVNNKDRKEVTFTIRNISGSRDVTISQLLLGGTNSTEFSLKNSDIPLTVSAGGTRDIVIVFEPTSLGNKSATLTVMHDGEGSSSVVNLTGESVLVITSTLDPVTNPVKIYPNPFTDNVTIDLSSMKDLTTINIYDAFGKLCKQYTSDTTLELNSSDFTQGIYYLHISQPGNDKVQTIKLVKK